VTSKPPAVGTAFFPEPDVAVNGTGLASTAGPAAGRLRGLPRRRRPAMIALAAAMVGAGVLISAAVFRQADHQVSVVTVTRPVPAGAAISPGDLGTARVTVGGGIRVIPASQLGQVAGEIAAVALRPGTLLAPSEVTSAQPPAPGQELVPASLKPSELPASGLFPGDHVLIIATPGDQGQTGASGGSPSLSSPVPGVVEAVNDVPDATGLDVVDLLVSDGNGAAVADQVSTGQFALIVTKRGS
jgi:SAF domain